MDEKRLRKRISFNENNPQEMKEYDWLSKLTVKEQSDLIHFALHVVGEKVGWQVPSGGFYGIVTAYASGIIPAEAPAQTKPQTVPVPDTGPLPVNKETDPYEATSDKYRPDIANAIQASLHQFRESQKKEN